MVKQLSTLNQNVIASSIFRHLYAIDRILLNKVLISCKTNLKDKMRRFFFKQSSAVLRIR